MTISERTCMIIGAGISGLMAGKALKKAGWKVTLLDKARGVGGRMATRRLQNGTFDHGAQFFTVRDPRFQLYVDSWLKEKIVEVWSSGFAEGPENNLQAGHPRYRGLPAMTGIPKHLAEGLDIHLQTRVVSIRSSSPDWEIETENGIAMRASALILTSPAPQSLVMLDTGNTRLLKETRDALEKITYDPCIALMVLTSARGQIPEPGAVRFKEGTVRWIADNHRKGVSAAFGLTMHTSPEFSRANWEKEKPELAEILLEKAKPWLGGEVLEWSVQKWRYSQPQTTHPGRCLVALGETPLIFAGDGFGAPRVEGAVLSGLSAADELIKSL